MKPKGKRLHVSSPCSNCPFRKDVVPYLTPERAVEIVTTQGTFPCHKTTTFDDNGNRVFTSKDKWCAGFLLLQTNSGIKNDAMQVSERLNMHDMKNIRGADLVYASHEEFIAAQDPSA
jgi:hypothetical protein